LINKYYKLPYHTHNDGVPCSNQGVATIFGLLRTPIAALKILARRSRTCPYCSRHRQDIRLALNVLATAKKFHLSGSKPWFGRSHHI
jgi:hypothetical protein